MNKQTVFLGFHRLRFSIVFLGVLLAIIFSTTVLASDEDITTPSNKTGLVATPIAITDLQVTGEGNDEVSLSLSADAGTLNLSVTTEVTIEGNDTGTLSVSGLREDVNAALNSLTYTSSGLGEDTITVDFGTTLTGDVIIDPDTGRAYSIVEDSVTWNEAVVAAADLEYGGVQGYLANITSEGEDQFLADNMSASVWIGANDIDLEGDWQWHGGPEAGTSFWSGTNIGSPVGGEYSNWNPSEPNDSGGEDCAEYIIGSGWNDLPCDGGFIRRQYIVEFGAGAELPDPITVDFTITTTGAEISIASCGELQALDDAAGNRFATVELTQDIDCSGVDNFEPLSFGEGDPFQGTFDGNDYTISGVTIERDEVDNSALFESMDEATFQDMTLTDGNILVTGEGYGCAALAGVADDTNISNVHVANYTIDCYDDVAGVFANFDVNDGESITVQNLSVDGGTFSSDLTIGGLFGAIEVEDYATLTVEEVYSEVTINSFEGSAGGILGTLDVVNDEEDGDSDSVFTLRNSYSKSDVMVEDSEDGDHAAGIAGRINVDNDEYDTIARAVFENVYSSGDITGPSEVAGIFGDIYSIEYEGEEVIVRNSFVTGAITGTDPDETHAIAGDDDFIEEDGTFTLERVYFDQTSTGQTQAIYEDDYEGSFAINTDGSEEDYFIGNSTNAPMTAWDFDDVWMVVADGTPVFQPVPEPVMEDDPVSEPDEDTNETPQSEQLETPSPSDSNEPSENLNSDPEPLPISRVIPPLSSNIRRFFVNPIANVTTTPSSEVDEEAAGDPITNFYADLFLTEPNLRNGDNHVESFNSELTVDPSQTGLLVWDFTSEENASTNRKLGIAIEIPENIASEPLTFTIDLQEDVDVQNILDEEVEKVGSVFKVTAKDSQGNFVTKFSAPIKITLFVPENLQGRDGLGVYYLSDGATEWEEVENVEFSQERVSFSVDHLTSFGIFESQEEPAEVISAEVIDEDEPSSRLVWWVWLLVILIVLILLLVLVKKSSGKSSQNRLN